MVMVDGARSRVVDGAADGVADGAARVDGGAMTAVVGAVGSAARVDDGAGKSAVGSAAQGVGATKVDDGARAERSARRGVWRSCRRT